MLSVQAPAKINLTLEVLGKRPDGYHEIKSVFQAVNFYDTLHFENGHGITFRCDLPEWSAVKSLVSRAVDLLQKAAGCSQGVTVGIEKRIPLLSGLGGDSSDAAALLRGLNELWELGLSREKLRELAAQLGSDAVFFLSGGTALAEGRGEIITPLPSLPEMSVVLVLPDTPVELGKTGRMYAALKPGHFTDGTITEQFVETIQKQGSFDMSLLFNTFENVAFESYPGLKAYKEHLMKLGAPHVHLAGSGPALFALFPDKKKAVDFHGRCQSRGMTVYLTNTGSEV